MSLGALSMLGGGGTGGGISASSQSGDIKSPVAVDTPFETGDGSRAVSFHIATSGAVTNSLDSILGRSEDEVSPPRKFLGIAPIEFVLLGAVAIAAGILVKISR